MIKIIPRESQTKVCATYSNRYFDCQKTKRAGFKPPREAARSLQFSRFFFEILGAGVRSRDYCLIRRLSMDSASLCPSLPPKILTDDRLKLVRKHTPRMAAVAVGFAVCILFVQLVNIESFSSQCAIQTIARPSLYKTGPSILSRTFSKNLRARICARLD